MKAVTAPARRVLMIAFQFPPFAGSSAIQRTLRFVQQLPRFGWEPIVLSAQAHAYEATSQDLLAAVPSALVVHRAFALDAARHLAIAGRYPAFLARPDRWTSWRWDAVRAGRALIRRYRPAALWSTFPIATAHAIGQGLHAATGLPWIADFRDPMVQPNYPRDPTTRRRYESVESAAVTNTRFCVFTTPGAAQLYRERYRDAPDGRFQVIENGYDEETFGAVEKNCVDRSALVPGAVTFLHSGVVYPSERDPTQLFDALAVLKREADPTLPGWRVRFRAAGHEALLRSMIDARGLADCVELQPPIPYAAAIEEMLRADALLLMQAANCNQQIPAKWYEYLRTGRPVLGLTDPVGDTAGAMRAAGLAWLARLDSVAEIADLFKRALRQIASGVATRPSAEVLRAASREARSESLASLLDRACA